MRCDHCGQPMNPSAHNFIMQNPAVGWTRVWHVQCAHQLGVEMTKAALTIRRRIEGFVDTEGNDLQWENQN